MTPQTEKFPLSPQQAAIWAHHQQGNPLSARCAIHISGQLDKGMLRQAFSTLLERHEIFCTLFGTQAGIPHQFVTEHPHMTWVELEEDKADSQFDFQNGMNPNTGPWLGAALRSSSPTEHVLSLHLPALCVDHPSFANIHRELAGILAQSSTDLPDEPVQYLDYSEWQHELREKQQAIGERFWKQQLEVAQTLVLPNETRQPTERTPAVHVHRVDRKMVENEENFLLTSWYALLFRLSGTTPLTLQYCLNERAHKDFKDGIGPFTNLVPLTINSESGLSFSALEERVLQARNNVRGYQFHLPHDNALDYTGKIGFVYIQKPEALQAGGLRLSLLDQEVDQEPYKLKLCCVRDGDALVVKIYYDAAVYDAYYAAELAQTYCTLLEKVAGADRLMELELFSQSRCKSLIESFNQTQVDEPAVFAHHRFEQQAADSPKAVALIQGKRNLTFEALEEKANRLAHYLQSRDIGPEKRVALLMEPSLEVVIALLAVLKAGAAYIPMDPKTPEARIDYLLDDCSADLLICASDADHRADRVCVSMESLSSSLDSFPASVPQTTVSALNAAYVIYTSGSTGNPKGVLVTHGNLANYLAWSSKAYAPASGEGAPLHSSLGFDLTVTCLFLPLLNGKPVTLIGYKEGIEGLRDRLREEPGFSVRKITPAHLNLLKAWFSKEEVAQWRGSMVIGGETLYDKDLELWLRYAPDVSIINEYGPTEATVGCCTYKVEGQHTGGQPIGKPIANTQLYLLDERMRALPFLIAGELYIGGAGLARGYLGRPARTAMSFVPDPFSSEPGARLYRSGDVARFIDGQDPILEFLGRKDHQVKIRGHRIELGEIEAQLKTHPDIKEAVVIARGDQAGSRRLIAYVLPKKPVQQDELRTFLGRTLPDYMLPSTFLSMERFKLTNNGKIDRNDLPEPSQARPDMAMVYKPPQTALEQDLVSFWQDALGVDRIGVDDNFFTLGGDSIRSLQVVALAKSKGHEITIQDIFQYPTISKLAQFLQESLEQDFDDDDEELAALLAEVEGLSDTEVKTRITDLNA